MISIGIVIPYYGKFPNYFDLFLKSCGKNPTIDWLVFTDIKDQYKYPENVRRIEMSFAQMKAMFQSRFDFPITLDSPYKLCDYKPMTGYLFAEFLKDYDYWGYSDVDMLFGDIRKFLTDEKIRKYDKIGHLGHLTIYRNDPGINTLFMKPVHGRKRYQEVLSTDTTLSFTEWYQDTINTIFIDQKKKVWFCNRFFDVAAYEDNFRRIVLEVDYDHPDERRWHMEKKDSFASWEDGHVYQWRRKGGNWEKKEYMYVHFQKRKMEVCIDPETTDCFLCVPDQFIPYADKIPEKYVIRSVLMGILNRKHWKQWVREMRYMIVERTGPVRHAFRRKRYI